MIDREELLNKRDEIFDLAKKRGVRSIRLFGSMARGISDGQSDVDFLIDLEPGRSLLDLGGLQIDLEALLGCHVDVATEASLRGRMRERVLREAVPL